MTDLFHFDQEMESYMRTLPEEVQRRIRQSNQKLGCKDDLVQCAERMMSGELPDSRL